MLFWVMHCNNALNEYQEYFYYAMRRFQLESPFNYQHELQLFDVLKDTVLNGIL